MDNTAIVLEGKETYTNPRPVERFCSFCGGITVKSTIPKWLYELRKAANYEVVMCDDCYKFFSPALTEAVIDTVDECIKKAQVDRG
jgi:hypothetical protein